MQGFLSTPNVISDLVHFVLVIITKLHLDFKPAITIRKQLCRVDGFCFDAVTD